MKDKFVVTIGREFGSGGGEIGRRLSTYFNIPCYDKELLTLVAKESGYCKEYFEKYDEKPLKVLSYFGYDTNVSTLPINHQLFLKQFNLIQKLASEKSGLQIGSVSTEFTGIEKEISNIESKSETLRLSLTQSMQDSIKYVKELKYAFTTLAVSQDELKTEKNPKWIEGFNSDINKALSKFPELIQFKDN